MEKLIKILSASRNYLNSLDISEIINYDLEHDTSYYTLQSGQEHYRLLKYVSTLFDNHLIFDVGTNKCMSAISLSYNKSNKVRSYDIIKNVTEYPQVSNIDFIIGDTTEDINLIECPLIFLDVDHDGIYENIFYKYLKNINWKGFLMLDDIYLNESMILFWNNISEDKYDLTEKGHWSGTGLVHFK
jgi:hypothetical protein